MDKKEKYICFNLEELKDLFKYFTIYNGDIGEDARLYISDDGVLYALNLDYSPKELKTLTPKKIEGIKWELIQGKINE